MSETITSRKYWQQVEDLAKEALSEAEGDRDRAFDVLHESCDGHQWVIYTAYNPQVLMHSASEDAWFNDFGPSEFNSYSDAMMKMAFAALHADTAAKLDELLSEAEESEP